jgi:type I restriction enzyme M protein
MTKVEIQSQQQKALHTKLWKMANDLRGNMEANEFKNYILGMIFYRHLSDNTLAFMNDLLKDDGITYQEAWENEDYRQALAEEALESLGYVIEPQYLFSTLIKIIEDGQFDIELLQKAIISVTESTLGTPSQNDFEGLFEDMDLSSSKLGKSVSDRSKLMAKILASIDEIDFNHENAEIDILGDAYEYLIGQFAANAGKKAGEFFTPTGPSELLCQLAINELDNVLSAADPTCGSGSLLLRLGKHANVRTYYGQELTSTTYNLCRMNMIIHDIPYQNFEIFNDDTIENDHFGEQRFTVQVANPPYSAKYSGDKKFEIDERFSAYGKLPPKSKADWAFVQHMIHHMDDNGRIAVLLPHGVLFRGAAEGVIRRYVIEHLNYLDAVIGLAPNLFFGTSIPVCVLVLRKDRGKNKDNIMFVDASKDFESGKNQNRLRDEDIEKIVDAYQDRKDIDKFAHVASMEEIQENDFNLNIPRYVDTFEEEEPVDLEAQFKGLEELKVKEKEIDAKLQCFFDELGL